ncbi:hypothetical protein RKD37_000638 [Streptomyces ambofaciens]
MWSSKPGVAGPASRGAPSTAALVGVEEVPQDDLPRPAVPQQQVVAEQQAVAVAGQPHHGQPDQWRLAGVEAPLPVLQAQGVDLGVRRRLDGVDVEAAARGEDLHRVPALVRGEARAHGRVPCEHVSHRPGQRVGVQAPCEGEPALGDVVSGRARQLGLEVQAQLERADRRRALGRRGGLRDPFQCAAPVLGDLVGDALGQGEGRVQAAGGRVGPRVHLDRVRGALPVTREAGCLGLAAPAQVVEEDLWPGGEQRGGLRVEVPEAAVGDVSALVRLAFGDLAGRGDGVGVRGEPYGRDGGEPADGAGVVVVVAGRDPAVPLQVDGQVGGGRLDAGQRGAQRPAQQLGETEAQCGGRGTGDAVADVGGERDRPLARVHRGGQRGGGLEGGDPVGQAVGPFTGPVRQCPGVLGVGRGLRCRVRAAHGVGQVVQQDQPGHGVDGEMVHGDHQRPGRLQPRERDDVAALGSEAVGRLVRRARHVGPGGPDHGDLADGFGAQGPHPVVDAQPQPQRRVRGDDGPRGALRVGEPGAFGRRQRPGLGEPGERSAQFPPAQHDRRGRQRAVLLARGCGHRGPRGARAQVLGERAGCPEQEHVARRDRQAERPGPVDHRDGDDAVASGGEEVGVGVRVGAGQRGGEDADECRERGAVAVGRRATVPRVAFRPVAAPRVTVPCTTALGRRQCRALGQRPAVELPVDRQRQGVHGQHAARHHVRGQLRRQQRGEVRRHRADDVRDQVVLAVGDGDGGVDHAVEVPEGGLHLARLDAEALQLDLVVGTAHELQLAVDRAAGEVARVVHAGAVRPERVGHEPPGGEPRPAQVAERDLVARDVDGAHPARWHRAEPVVEEVGDEAGDRTADRAGGGRAGSEVGGGQHPVGDVDGGLGDAVHVDQLGRVGAVPLDPAAQPPGVQRLAPEDDPAQCGQRLARVPVGLGEPVERRRGLVEHGHPALADQAVEVDRGAGQPVLRHQQLTAVRERAPQLPDGEVEGEGVELDPHVVRTDGHQGPGTGKQRHDTGVRDDDALGPPGRSGRVDHVRGVVPVGPGSGFGSGGRVPLPRYEHAGRNARTVQEPGEPVALLRVHEDDLRGGVGEDVLQALVRVRQVQRYVGPARGDDGDQGDDLLDGARHGHGDPLAGADTDRAQRGGQLVLGSGQFPVGQGPSGAVEGALGDGGGGRVAAGRGVEQVAQGGRGDRLDVPGARGGQVADRGVRPGEQGGEVAGEGAQDLADAGLPQQFGVVDQVEARSAVRRAFHHQRQRVVRGTLVDDAGDGEGVAGPPECGHVGRHVEHHQGVEERPGTGPAGDPRQGDVLVRQYRALVRPDGGEQFARGGGGRPAGAQGNRVDEQAHHGLDAGHVRVPPGDRGAEHHVVAVQDAAEGDGPGAVHGDAQRHTGRPGGRVDVGVHCHGGVGEVGGGRVPVGDQRRAGEFGQLLVPHPVARLVVACGEAAHVVGEAAERVSGTRRVVLGQQGAQHGRHRPAVGDDVVHRLHQDVPAASRADECVPRQRAGGEVESGAAVPLGEGADLVVGDARGGPAW